MSWWADLTRFSYRELELLLPQIESYVYHPDCHQRLGHPGVLTNFRKLNVVISVDGLQPEHDSRRKPATYERILKNIEGARVTIHCTITSQMMGRPGYLDEFLSFWTTHNRQESVVQHNSPARRHRSGDPDAFATDFHHCGSAAIAAEVSQSGNARVSPAGVRASTQQPGRMHLCENYRDDFRRPQDDNHSLPVRRRP